MMQMSKLKCLIGSISAIVILTACQTTSGSKPPTQRTVVPSNFEPSLSTRVFYGDCLRTAGVSGKQSALLGIFGAALISNALDRIGSALRKAGEEDAYKSTAHRNLQISPPEVTQCVQVVRGKFDSSMESWNDLSEAKNATFLETVKSTFSNLNANSSAFRGANAGDTLNAMTDALGKSDITAFTAHSFIFEGQLRASLDDSALTLVPTFYDYAGAIKPKRSAKKEYAVLLSFSVHKPGTPATHEEAAGTSIALGALKPGTHKIYPLPSKAKSGPHDTPWFTNFAPKPPAKSPKSETRTITRTLQNNQDGTFVETNTVSCEVPRSEVVDPRSVCLDKGPAPKPDETIVIDDFFGKSARPNSKPRILTATITETEAADKVLLFFADVFDASKEGLGTEIGNHLIPSQRKANQLAGHTAGQEALIKYYTDVAAAETAQDAFCKLPEASTEASLRTSATAAYTAQIKANLAALSTEFGVPYPVLIEPSGKSRTECPATAN